MSEKWNPSEETLEEYKKRIGASKGVVDVEGIKKLREDLEEKTLEAEEHKAKLAMVAQAKFEEKKEAIEERISRTIKDEDRRKELLEKINDEEKPMNERIRAMQGIELGLDVIQNVKPKTKAPTSKPSGVVSLASQGAGSEGEGFSDYESMVRHVILKAKSPHKPTSREAKKIMDTLLEEKLTQALKSGKKFSVKIPSDKQLSEGKGLVDVLNEGLEPKKREMIARKKALEEEGREQ